MDEIRRFTRIIPETRVSVPLPENPINLVLLLHMNGLNGSTTFTDSSPSNHTVTVSGAAQISTATSVFGGASGSFPGGAGDWLTLDGSTDFRFIGDFTIDFRVNSSFNTFTQGFYDSRLTIDGPFVEISCHFDGTIDAAVGTDADGVILSGTTPINDGIWHHVALTRKSGTVRLFIDGVSEGGTGFSNRIMLNEAGRPIIGALAVGGGSLMTNGNLDEFRVINGFAAFTSNFTVPTSPYYPP